MSDTTWLRLTIAMFGAAAILYCDWRYRNRFQLDEREAWIRLKINRVATGVLELVFVLVTATHVLAQCHIIPEFLTIWTVILAIGLPSAIAYYASDYWYRREDSSIN